MSPNQNWLTSLFTGTPGAQDAIKSGPLNSTKITAIVGVIATGVAAASKTLFGKSGPLSGLTHGQELMLWLGTMGFVAAVVIVDMIVRGQVTGKVSAAEECAPVVWFNPTRRASSIGANGDPGGAVVALRPSGDDLSGIQYLVIRDPAPGTPDDTARQTAWVGASMVLLK